jgi:hypothetical protein
MKKIAFFIFILGLQLMFAVSLKQVYENAQAGNGYDKFIELETGEIYTGGLLMGQIFDPITATFVGEEAGNVYINGNGAILDLQGEQICYSFTDFRFDIEDCVIINGNIRFRGDSGIVPPRIPQGSVRYVTFYQPHDYGIRLQGAGEGIEIERNIIVDVVDTGDGYVIYSGFSHYWMPTGTSISVSIQTGSYGYPNPHENWTFHSDSRENEDPLTHFSLLCEYG